MSYPKDAPTTEFDLVVDSATLPQLKPYSSLVDVEFAAETHVGNCRQNNEDSYLIFHTGRYWERLHTSLPEDELPRRFEEKGYVMAVADGMGGMEAGEVASSLALRTAAHLIITAAQWALRLDDPAQRETEIVNMKERVLQYLRRIDQTLTLHCETHPHLRGMGTTLTSSYSVGDDLFVVHIGDSRAYLFRRGVLQQLTNDHTVAQVLADLGAISTDDAAQHRLRHVLTKAIGGQGGNVEAEVNQYRLLDCDQLLLCSDGLTNMVDDEEIADVLENAETASKACHTLIELALQNGGRDNITVTLGRYTLPDRE